jgi:hypothetical protein
MSVNAHAKYAYMRWRHPSFWHSATENGRLTVGLGMGWLPLELHSLRHIR